MDWQPIETAPRNGTVILLSRGHDVYAGWWSGSDNWPWWIIDDTKESDEVMPGFIEPNGLKDEGQLAPRYWMPLPKGPESRS